MSPVPEPFLRCLSVQLEALNINPGDRLAVLHEARRAPLSASGRDFRDLAKVLSTRAVSSAWNHALEVDRPQTLARMIAPFALGSVIDLLCGDGAVAKALEQILQRKIAMIERRQHRGTCSRPWQGEILDFEQDGWERRHGADTVLMCTVLHHEQNLDRLLDIGAKLAKRRLIVVENTIGGAVDHETHLMVDVFFNRCLNETLLDSPGQHRSADDWMRYLGRVGKASHVGGVERVPGVPLPHDVFVVDL